MEVPFHEFPKARVFFGGCVKRGEGSNIRRSGHAHTMPGDEFYGWICIKGKRPEILRLPDGEPTNLLKHEYAHILCPNQYHTKKFWLTLAKIGGYMEYDSYKCISRKEVNSQRAKWDEVKELVLNNQILQ
jgi:hypothetical protein